MVALHESTPPTPHTVDEVLAAYAIDPTMVTYVDRPCDVKGPVVYLIVCLVTGRIYVGSTRHFGRRYSSYRCDIRRRTRNTVIIRAMVKYGLEQFRFVILESATMTVLREREQYWLDALCPFGDRGYNTEPRAAVSTHTYRRPGEIRQMRRMSGLQYGEATRQRSSKPVCQIDPKTLKVVHQHASATAAAKIVGRKIGAIAAAVRKRQKAAGWYWCYQSVYDAVGFTPSTPLGWFRSIRPVQQLDDMGTVLRTWDSCSEAAAAIGTSVGVLSNARRKGFRCRGYRWRLVTDPTIVAEAQARRRQRDGTCPN